MTGGRDQALAFYDMVVGPTVSEFLNRPSDQRLVCLACLCLSASSEHYVHATAAPNASRKAVAEFRRASRLQNWAIGQMHEIANATKHVARDGKAFGYRDIEAQEIRVGDVCAGWPINGLEVMVEVAPDELWLVRDLVGAADEWWQVKLNLRTA